VLGQLVLVKGALYSTAIGGKDRFSGYAPLRLKSLRDSRLTSGTQANSRTPPDRLVGRLDPITTALPEDEGVSIGAWREAVDGRCALVARCSEHGNVRGGGKGRYRPTA
jgi:hypothetical protein